jgi:hypothetical protein
MFRNDDSLSRGSLFDNERLARHAQNRYELVCLAVKTDCHKSDIQDKVYYLVRESKLQTPMHSQLNPIIPIASNFFKTPSLSTELVVKATTLYTLLS